jgi:hypothetical protein
MKQAITSYAAALTIGLFCGLFNPAHGSGNGDICVHLNGGADVAYVGVDNTLEIWIANDVDLRTLQFSLRVCWVQPMMFWNWDFGYGDSPPIMRHGDALENLTTFAHAEAFDNLSCEPFVIGATTVMYPAGTLPAGSSRLCYSLKFQIVSPLYAYAILVMPYPYFASSNWYFTEESSPYPPDFCGQAISDMDNPTATPIAFSIVAPPPYTCGDADGSAAVDIDDVVFLIAYIFSGGPEPVPYESGDADCSGAIDIDDVVYLIAYIFSGGPAPCDPDGDSVPDC